MTFLKLEMGAALATVILIIRAAPKLGGVPIPIKLLHFAFILLLTILGIDGFHIITLILRRHQEYIIEISSANPFGLSALLMEYVGYAFALAGAVLCFTALRLGDFRNWARRTIIWLAPPYCILYPGIISTINDESRWHGNFHFAYVMTPIFFVMSVGVVIFYSSKSVGKYFK